MASQNSYAERNRLYNDAVFTSPFFSSSHPKYDTDLLFSRLHDAAAFWAASMIVAAIFFLSRGHAKPAFSDEALSFIPSGLPLRLPPAFHLPGHLHRDTDGEFHSHFNVYMPPMYLSRFPSSSIYPVSFHSAVTRRHFRSRIACMRRRRQGVGGRTSLLLDAECVFLYFRQGHEACS